jgi:hypothetical protein
MFALKVVLNCQQQGERGAHVFFLGANLERRAAKTRRQEGFPEEEVALLK